jgi:hypothetical protein
MLKSSKVDETKIVMEDNVKKMLQNQQNLDTLSNKADKLNNNAQGFYKNSSELVKKTKLIYRPQLCIGET